MCDAAAAARGTGTAVSWTAVAGFGAVAGSIATHGNRLAAAQVNGFIHAEGIPGDIAAKCIDGTDADFAGLVVAAF